MHSSRVFLPILCYRCVTLFNGHRYAISIALIFWIKLHIFTHQEDYKVFSLRYLLKIYSGKSLQFFFLREKKARTYELIWKYFVALREAFFSWEILLLQLVHTSSSHSSLTYTFAQFQHETYGNGLTYFNHTFLWDRCKLYYLVDADIIARKLRQPNYKTRQDLLIIKYSNHCTHLLVKVIQ